MKKLNRDTITELTIWGVSTVTFAVSATIKTVFKWLGLPFASLLGVATQVWDHKLEEERIAREYGREIAAKRGIPPGSTTVKDLYIVAKENPTLAQLLRRNRLKRNIGIAVTLVSSILGFMLAFAFAGPLATFFVGAAASATTMSIATAFTGGAIGLVTFVASKLSINEICGRIFDLKEPYIREVQHDPALQDKLSLPSQIRYLERLQHRKIEISEDQVVKVFDKAHPELSYQEIMERYPIAQITDDLNHRRRVPQELAFTVYGQQSGVPRSEQSEDGLLRMGPEGLHQRMADTQEMINTQLKLYSLAALENAGKFGNTVKEKAAENWQNTIMPKNLFDPAALAAERLAKGSAITPEAVRESQQKDTPAGITN